MLPGEAFELAIPLAVGVATLAIILVPRLRGGFRDVLSRRPRLVAGVFLGLFVAAVALDRREWTAPQAAGLLFGVLLGVLLSASRDQTKRRAFWAMLGGGVLGMVMRPLAPAMSGFVFMALIGACIGEQARRFFSTRSTPLSG